MTLSELVDLLVLLLKFSQLAAPDRGTRLDCIAVSRTIAELISGRLTEREQDKTLSDIPF